MRTISLILLFTFFLFNSISAASNFPKYDESQPDKLCKDKWTKRGVLDENMYNYCMGNAQDGYNEAFDIYKEFQTMDWINDVLKHSYEKWTERGNTDYRMFAYEMNLQKEGFLDLEYEIMQGNVTGNEVKKCTNKWYPEFRMIVYCLKN